MANSTKGTTLTSWDPSWRDKAAWFISDMLAGSDGSKNRGLRNYVNDKVRSGVDYTPVVGDAVGFNEAKRNFDQGNYGAAAFDATTSAVGSFPVVGDTAASIAKLAGGSAAAKYVYDLFSKPVKHDPSQLNTFMGPSSNTFNGDAFQEALSMAKSRSTDSITERGHIWDKTGNAFNPVDGKWRQEIDDSGAGILSGPLASPTQTTVDKVLDHPKLFEAYPDLAKTSLVTEDFMEGGSGFFNPYDNIVGLSLRDPFGENLKEGDVLGTLLHELQHGIQTREKFAAGSSPDMSIRFAPRPGSPSNVAMRSFMNSAGIPESTDVYDFLSSSGIDTPLEEFDALRASNPKLARNVTSNRQFTPEFIKERDAALFDIAVEMYLRNAGEVEARNVEIRNMLRKSAFGWGGTGTQLSAPDFTQSIPFLHQLSEDDMVYGQFKVPKGEFGKFETTPLARRR